MDVSMTDRVAIHSSVICRELDGEMVLLQLDSGVYYGLDAVGARAWTLLADEKSLADVCAVMLDEYDVAADALRGDLTALVRDLCEKQLLVPRRSGS